MEKIDTRPVQTLDVRETDHAERLPAILGSWRALQPGHALRLVVDHNPMPLQFLFNAESPGQFHWEYEKQGPDSWVVRITRLAAGGAAAEKVREAEERDKRAIKSVLTRLAGGEDAAAVKEEAKDVLRQMDASRLAMLEQEIIQEGVGREQMRKLCDVHLEVMRESLDAQNVVPEEGHPIRTMMEEHKVLKRHLEELKGYLEAIKVAQGLPEISSEVEGARSVAHQLLEAESHHQREEQVIFPALEARGVNEPPAIMREEHVDLRARKKRLAELTSEPALYTYRDWVKDMQEVGGYLVQELGNHIYKEDNILYQTALQTVEPEAWAEMKARCDKIGYCCFTPGVGTRQS